MIATKPKPIEDILDHLNGQESLVIVACTGCPEGCESGDAEQLDALRAALQEAGKHVVAVVPIDFLCNKSLIARRLMSHLDELNRADALLVSSCGIGVQAVASTVDKVTHPVLDTISMGGFQGLWPGAERCMECGDCVLHLTGGICPRVACSKGLLTGQCGGATDDGKCEVDPAIPCGWVQIYERLQKLDRLDLLRRYVEPLDHRNLTGDVRHRPTTWWALERMQRGEQLAVVADDEE
jgi:hypothetical protein